LFNFLIFLMKIKAEMVDGRAKSIKKPPAVKSHIRHKW
jgi:hypothetical protein